MKIILVTALIFLCSCLQDIEQYNMSRCEEKTVTEYVILNPQLVNKCFFKENLNRGFHRISEFKNNSYIVNRFTKGCFSDSTCKLVEIFDHVADNIYQINSINNETFVECPKTLEEIENE